MQTLRVRIKASAYKEVERRGDITIVRWDASKETIKVPKKVKKGEEPQYETKETGYLICTERVYHGEVTKEMVQKDMESDLNVRYGENKPEIAVPEI